MPVGGNPPPLLPIFTSVTQRARLAFFARVFSIWPEFQSVSQRATPSIACAIQHKTLSSERNYRKIYIHTLSDRGYSPLSMLILQNSAVVYTYLLYTVQVLYVVQSGTAHVTMHELDHIKHLRCDVNWPWFSSLIPASRLRHEGWRLLFESHA